MCPNIVLETLEKLKKDNQSLEDVFTGGGITDTDNTTAISK